jgi:hypothetical protein
MDFRRRQVVDIAKWGEFVPHPGLSPFWKLAQLVTCEGLPPIVDHCKVG